MRSPLISTASRRLSGVTARTPFVNHIDSFAAFLASRTRFAVATQTTPDHIAEAQRMARELKRKWGRNRAEVDPNQGARAAICDSNARRFYGVMVSDERAKGYRQPARRAGCERNATGPARGHVRAGSEK